MPKKQKSIKQEFGMYKDDEARRKALEESRRIMIQKRIQEEQISHINSLKIQTRWRELMKQSKSTVLHKELEQLLQVFHRRLDTKQKTIGGLQDYIHESDSLFEHALQGHMINIDTLITLQTSKLDSLYEQFNSDVQSLHQEFQMEKMLITTNQIKMRSDVLGVMTRQDHEFQEVESDAKHEYSSIRDDVRNKVLFVLI